jgi:phosphoserine phosphatase
LSTLKKLPIGVFDVDGTFVRGSLFLALTKILCEQKIFPPDAFTEKYAVGKAKERWENRQGSYQDYLKAVVDFFFQNIVGVEQYRVQPLADLATRRIYRQVNVFTREVFNVARKSHYKLAITGSQQEMLTAFQRYWPFEFFLSTVFEVKYGRYTGSLVADPIQDKKAALRGFVEAEGLSLDKSFGLGDTESDIDFLEEVSFPICVNPNFLLLERARDRNWPIVLNVRI